MDILKHLSERSRNAPESGIVELVNYARGRQGLIPLWVGEGDSPTADFISKAAADALMAGETFYTWQRGTPEIRMALAAYYARHFSANLKPENFFVTGSGMQAIKLAIEAVENITSIHIL
jgi:aspartate/methionine/tyrosine aminotransferase